MIVRTLLALCLCLPAQAAEFPPVKDLMSEQELEETGLYKLNDKERPAFRRWLEIFVERDAEFVERHYRQQRRQNSTDQEQVVKEEKSEEAGAIRSRIVGKFTGWEGRSRFELANGQVWQQRRKQDMFRHRPLDSPEVIIRKNFLGFFTMEIPAANTKLPVKRLE